ncbi:MAG: PDZ domain-containing protein [Proteobacteria bacterium]|nr:PDZ domain-containing protein [Pseudomonadota bacterium]
MKLLLLTIALLLPSAALAGDPCPITLELHEYTPTWRDRGADLDALESQRSWYGLNYRGTETVRVRHVIAGSPAAASGLAAGDLLTSFNGTPITSRSHLGELFDALGTSNSKVSLGVDRKGTAMTVELVRGAADPVFFGLVNATESTECRSVSIWSLTEAQAAAVASGAFTDQRGFRCDDAHTAMGSAFESGDVIMIRGGRRILLTMPGWGTTCVAVADYDGAKLTTDALSALLERLAKAYVADRHDNP